MRAPPSRWYTQATHGLVSHGLLAALRACYSIAVTITWGAKLVSPSSKVARTFLVGKPLPNEARYLGAIPSIRRNSGIGGSTEVPKALQVVFEDLKAT